MLEEKKIPKNVIGSVIATGILAFCGVLAETAMNVAFPTLIEEFQISTSTVQWLTTIYLLVLAIIVPLSGYLKVTYKNKHLFLAGILFFTVGVIIDAIAPSFLTLLLGRIIQGIGTGIALPLMFNIILEQVPINKIGVMMGVGTMIPAIAPAIGPTFGGIIVSSLGWRYIFILLIPILFISLILGIISIKQKSNLKKVTFDYTSLLAISVAFIGFIFGFSNMGSHVFISLGVGGSFLLGVVSLIFLIDRSKKINNPILQFNLLKNKSYCYQLISFFILQLVLMGLVFILPIYIQMVNGSTAHISGLVVLPGATLGALFTPLGGRVLDKFGAKKPILFGSAIIFISMIIFALLCGNVDNLIIGILYFIFTIGVGFSFGNLMTNGLEQLKKNQQADGTALIMTFQQFAGASGTSIIAAVISKSQFDNSRGLVEGTISGCKLSLIVLIILFSIELILLIRLFRASTNKSGEIEL